MNETDDILDLARMASAHQQDDILTTVHTRLLAYWPDWHFRTAAALKAHMSALRTPARARDRAAKLTPVSLAEIQDGYTYLAARTGSTTALFKLFTADTKANTLKGYEAFYRIDHE